MSIYGISSKGPISDNRKIAKKVNHTKEFELIESSSDDKASSSVAINKTGITNPFIMLNEVSNEEIEREFLKKNGKKVIDCLKIIRVGLLSGDFKESQLINLANSIDSLVYSFQSQEIQNLVEEIKLRAEVELAKLYKSML